MAIILASQSPRRKELLQQVGIHNFSVIPATGEEKKDPNLKPAQLVEELSLQKAEEVASRCQPDDTVIAADTVVVLNGTVLGKPRDASEAEQMLCALSGKQHQVYTGVTVRKGDRVISEHEETRVYFRELSREEIAAYIATGEPLDKAGAYGIQGLGAGFIPKIEGDYFNVVGLPLCRLLQMLERLA